MDKQIQIVDATIEDAHAIGEIQKQTWTCNYPNPAIGITREDIAGKIKQWDQKGDERIIIQMQKKGARTWVAKDGDKIIGFMGLVKTDSKGKVETLHVLPGYQGQGIGTKMLEIGLKWLEDSKPIAIEVVSYNVDAIRLYKKFGFIEQGESSDDPIILPRGNIIPKILMVKS